MAVEYVVDGPIMKDITEIHTTPQFALNSRIVTKEIGSERIRIYRYVRYDAAQYVGTAVTISSVGRLLNSASTTTAVGLGIAVPQVTLTSPTASQTSLYTAVQTGGWFGGGALNGPGIYTNSAVAGSELYLTGTASTCSTTPAATVVSLGAIAQTTGSSSNVIAWSEDELTCRKDLLA